MNSTMASDRKIAIVTGANSGVGYGIVERLLEWDCDNLTVVLACRNEARAMVAWQSLLQEFPKAKMDILIVDLGNCESVLKACKRVYERYKRLDYLYCNAGFLSATGVKWAEVIPIFLRNPISAIESSDLTQQITGEINDDHVGLVFACNVLGHYFMIRELEPLLKASGDGRVIWTSSGTASSSTFAIDDWQGVKAKEPYESSKWATNITAIYMNEQFRKQNVPITSVITSPGVVASNIGGLPAWVGRVRRMVHYAFRFGGLTSQNINSYNGAISNLYCAQLPLKELDPNVVYSSCTDRWGYSFVDLHPIQNYMPETAKILVDHLEALYQEWKTKVDAAKD
ncbi:unnamed protein product [Umbelopsis ramanniana]